MGRTTSLSSSARPAARRAPFLPPPFCRARPILPSRAPSFPLPPAPRPSPARPSAPLVARGVRCCRAPPPPPCAPFCILLFAITTPLYEIRLFTPLILLSLPSFPLQPSPFLRLLSPLSCSSWLLISPCGCASLHSSPLYQDPSPYNPPLHPPPLLSPSFPLPISLSPPPLSSLHLPELVADLVSSSCSACVSFPSYGAHSCDSLSSSPLLPSPSCCCPSSLTPPSPTLRVIRSPLSHLDRLSLLPLDLSSCLVSTVSPASPVPCPAIAFRRDSWC
ncbi:unnamed protein product [Closterium sp. Naga37s-1]|nr:unnamed protein product [Closterium sp. Naga37s-1]